MSHFLAELEIDRACEEFLQSRGLATGNPQPIVQYLDGADDDGTNPLFDSERWNEAMRRAVELSPEPGTETCLETYDRMLSRMKVS